MCKWTKPRALTPARQSKDYTVEYALLYVFQYPCPHYLLLLSVFGARSNEGGGQAPNLFKVPL